jgi:hypothetical protein
MARMREIQRAHKSDKFTVAQAKKIWLQIERESAAKTAKRSTVTGRVLKKDGSPTGASSSSANGTKQVKRASPKAVA